MSTLLVITNDFPPRQGGIETFVIEVLKSFPHTDIVVYASWEPGADEFDATLPFPVIRDKTSTLLPTPRMTKRAIEIARTYGCDRVWVASAAPLGFMSKALREAGVKRIVVTSHGHEVWWARVLGARSILRRIGRDADIFTYLGNYTRARIAPALKGQAFMARLVPGAHTSDFGKQLDPQVISDLKATYGLEGKKVILCVSRLVKLKGQETLIKAMPAITAAVPNAALVLVGKGSQEKALRKLAAGNDAVIFAGGQPHAKTIEFYAAADTFALATRPRFFGLVAEGLGIVALEASASRLPVVIGNTGGAPDTVIDGVTGHVVEATNVTAMTNAIIDTLTNPQAHQMGVAGRQWVQEHWSWEGTAQRLEQMLDPNVPLAHIVADNSTRP